MQIDCDLHFRIYFKTVNRYIKIECLENYWFQLVLFLYFKIFEIIYLYTVYLKTKQNFTISIA